MLSFINRRRNCCDAFRRDNRHLFSPRPKVPYKSSGPCLRHNEECRKLISFTDVPLEEDSISFNLSTFQRNPEDQMTSPKKLRAWLTLPRGIGITLSSLSTAALLWSGTAPIAVANPEVVVEEPVEEEPVVEEPVVEEPVVEEPVVEELVVAEPVPDALDTVEVPLPEDLSTYIKDNDAAILLGKSLFWDTQASSDGTVACASCHWHAGADARTRNTLYPGAPGGAFGAELAGQEELDHIADVRFNAIGRANQVLVATDFPTHRMTFPTHKHGSDNPVLSDNPEVVGSQGVHETDFLNIVEGSAVDEGTPAEEPEYHLHGISLRQQTVRNTPTMINAVFNDRQFWDGRAQRSFNGVNPFGELDKDARVHQRIYSNSFDDKLTVIFAAYPWAEPFEAVFRRFQFIVYWFLPTGFQGIESIEPVRIEIENASLASQAVGPTTDDTEMSFLGRSFPEVGRKMFSLAPLAQQEVHPMDSVLGPYANVEPEGEHVALEGEHEPATGLIEGMDYAQMVRDAFQDEWWAGQTTTDDGFTHMETNFSLFWGLSIMMYESTLVSDDSPFDQHQRGDDVLNESELRGMDIFMGAGACINCHKGSEFTGASVAAASHEPIEFMTMDDKAEAFYDNGFYNIGVRPTLEDIGVGATHPEYGPLSFSKRRQNGEDLGQDINVPDDARMAVLGSFKTPGLRNVELTGPYMHNGGMRTLTEVVEFYTRGSDFHSENIDDLDPDVGGIEDLQGNPEGIADLVAFMKALTDERVRYEKAPFDHPSLVIVNGHEFEHKHVSAEDILDDFVIPAVGKDGGIAVIPFDEIVPGAVPEAEEEVVVEEEEVVVEEEASEEEAREAALLELLKGLAPNPD
jgi:cytochrome c peroxidase